MKKQAEIGVFGGSGFYSFLENVDEISVDTPYGPPSSQIALANLGNKRVAFLPRHGKDHSLPPHKIPYRANVYAMKELGVKRIIGPCAAGSLQPRIELGNFVVCDQFVNKTWGRKDTFYDGPITTHISPADPYCSELREIAANTARKLDIPVHDKGTVVIIQGPRFSTRAESKEFSSNGWEVINMTQYPEVILARELGMCYVNISLITDYDVGLADHHDIEPVTHEMVIEVFNSNNEKLQDLLITFIKALPSERSCLCEKSLTDAGR